MRKQKPCGKKKSKHNEQILNQSGQLKEEAYQKKRSSGDGLKAKNLTGQCWKTQFVQEVHVPAEQRGGLNLPTLFPQVVASRLHD